MFTAGTAGASMKAQYWFMVLLSAAAWTLILCNNKHATAEAAAATADDLHDSSNLRYERVRFTITHDTTAADYDKFILSMISVLRSGLLSNDIPLLRDANTTPISHSNRFVLVELVNSAQETITLAIDSVNVYLVAYQTGNQSFFFRDAPTGASSFLFNGTNRQNLTYGGSYVDLENKAGAARDQIDLGPEQLRNAVSSLYYASGTGSAQPRSFIVVIEMICEAVRFRDISWRVRQSIGSWQSFVPNTYLLALENSWSQLSNRVQESIGGVFTTKLSLQIVTGEFRNLTNVREVIASLSLMVFVCRDRSSIMSSSDDDGFRHLDPPLLIRPVVENDDATCAKWEPTVRISGRDGLCVDVRDSAYNNGNPVQLRTCKSDEDPNQLWTIRSDGTIRSNGSCLTTDGYAVGNYVMIYDCNTAATAATRWEIWENGTIFNPQSALVLGGGILATDQLTVQANDYSPRQGWFASNDTKPHEVTIVSFSGLCMQENGPAMEECVSGKQAQIWALYGDGSIRPKQNQSRCLTCLSDSQSTLVTIESCSSGSSGQRWVFTNDGAILNLNSGMVMEVRQSDPSVIIINSVTGSTTQAWLPLPA